MIPRSVRVLVLCGLLLVVANPVSSQTKAKRSLRHSDYAAWRSIQAPILSPNGTIVAYALAPQEGDGEFVVRNLVSGKEYRHPRGSQPRPQPTVPKREPAPGPFAPLFSPDLKVVAFPIYPAQAEKAKTRGQPAAGMALGLMSLADGKVTRIDRVRSYQVAEEGPAILVYQRGTVIPMTDASKGAPPKGRTPPATPATAPPVQPAELVIRNLTNGAEQMIADVTEYQLSKDGKWLAYIAGRKEEEQGVYAIAPGRPMAPLVLRNGGGRYSRLTWDEKQSQLAFLHTPSAKLETTPKPPARLYHWKPAASPVAVYFPPPATGFAALTLLAAQSEQALARELTPGPSAFEPGYRITDQGGLSFSPDGSRVYFSVTPPPPPPEKIAPEEEKAVVELWHYKDDFIQPMRKVRYTPAPAYRAVFHLGDSTCRQLAGESITQVNPARSGDWALGLDDRAYRPLVGIEDAKGCADAWLINSRTGAKKLLAKKQAGPLLLSPGGKHLIGYDGKDWHSRSVPGGKKSNLTEKLGVSFANELHDVAGAAPPYGVAGWTKDERVLIYDRYDVWLIHPDGSGAKNLTAGLGRKTTTQFRLEPLQDNERTYDPDKPLLARAENERTRDTGFYRVVLGETPKMLLMAARNYSMPVRARKSDKLLLHVSTFYDYPDLYVADADFKEIRRISDANPQRADFLWGRASLIHYKSSDGVPLSGVLIKPENFDPKKRYPMIVYIYERLSQNLHRFSDPAPGTVINPAYYASNGYLVLMPDIAYTVGYPGQSAVKCVLPAIQAVVDQGCVDEKAIGIQGHSWGGYQTAYLITQTTRFKAAAAGAPVANMTSAYGGIRWGTGLPRQFQYEKTQSRIGGSLWQYPTRYLENSPLFHADRIKTPLLMLHNDKDDAVPWQQGIEFYLALRRLGKEAYLFNYPGEPHGLRRRANQMDYTVRMQQFFDHHLKGAEKPAWMQKGLPYTPPPAGTETPRRRIVWPRS
jgi:dipeptidyl aminopeptidase/acylaminoacyl peptidase